VLEPVTIVMAIAGILFLGYVSNSINLLRARSRWIAISLFVFVAILVFNRSIPPLGFSSFRNPAAPTSSVLPDDSPNPNSAGTIPRAVAGWQNSLGEALRNGLNALSPQPYDSGNTPDARVSRPVSPSGEQGTPNGNGSSGSDFLSPDSASSPTPSFPPSNSVPSPAPVNSIPSPVPNPANSASNGDSDTFSGAPEFSNSAPDNQKKPVSAWW
jgi:hypothetical protein